MSDPATTTSDRATTGRISPTTTASSTGRGPPATAVSSTTGPPATAAPSTTTPPATAASSTTTSPATEHPSGVDGVVAGDVGDPYYPTLGNVGIDAVHYDLAFDYRPDTGDVDAVATIHAVAEVDLAGFDLDLAGLEATGVTVDGRPARFTQDPAELQITLPAAVAAGTPLTVEVAYGGRFGEAATDSQGFEVGWIVEPWGSYVAAEPDGAHRWFPADDHPSDKATFSVAVAVPSGYDVVAAGRLAGREDLPGGRVRWRYAAAEPMATYLMSVAVGDFELIEEDGPDGVVLRHGVPLAFVDDQRLALTGEMIDVVAGLFGPFPLLTYGVLVVPAELGFALENQTLTLIGTDLMERPDLAETVLVHEVAHQWAGDWVSPQRWSDVWLNEGLATYAEWWWSEQRGGRTVADHAAAARTSARVAGLGPPLDPGVADLFGASVYVRGALVLDALQRRVGDEVFSAILGEWFARHGGGSASTDDFLSLVAELGGAEAADALGPWLTAEEIPTS